MKTLVFENGKHWTRTTTKSGRPATVYENDRNIRRPMYQLVIDGKTVFTRGTMAKVLEKLETM